MKKFCYYSKNILLTTTISILLSIPVVFFVMYNVETTSIKSIQSDNSALDIIESSVYGTDHQLAVPMQANKKLLPKEKIVVAKSDDIQEKFLVVAEKKTNTIITAFKPVDIKTKSLSINAFESTTKDDKADLVDRLIGNDKKEVIVEYFDIGQSKELNLLTSNHKNTIINVNKLYGIDNLIKEYNSNHTDTYLEYRQLSLHDKILIYMMKDAGENIFFIFLIILLVHLIVIEGLKTAYKEKKVKS